MAEACKEFFLIHPWRKKKENNIESWKDVNTLIVLIKIPCENIF